ncbi:ead/Ea22-like family protein [Enterobacter roggenkampii]|nr:ead/Ea22-like family protein [Enterobacter roggenkampii]
MSNIDKRAKRALREAAEKATKGQWVVEFDDEIYSTDGVNNEQIAMVFSENEARDAAFIAAANPATVLALLDELEAAEKRIAELEAREVKLPKPISVLHRRDFMDAHRSIYAYPEAEVNAALADAGINAAAAGKGE